MLAFPVFLDIHGDSRSVGKKTDCFRKRKILVSSQEDDRVAAGAAAETAEDLLLRTYAERWRLVVVKGTETLEILSDLFKRYKRTDEFDDVGGVKNAIDRLLCNAGHIIASFNPRCSICAVDNWAEIPPHWVHFTHSHGLSPISFTNREGIVGSPYRVSGDMATKKSFARVKAT